MEEESQTLLSTVWVRRILLKAAWSILGIFWEFSVPIIQYVFLFFLIVLFASMGYYFLNIKLVPQALMSEPLYFDFSQPTPIARLSILSRERQWYYTGTCMTTNKKQNPKYDRSLPTASAVNNGRLSTQKLKTMKNRVKGALINDSQQCIGQGRTRFLRAGFRYSIDLIFGLANSPKNLLLGKFMVHAKVVDSEGDAVATSSRPVVVPYQSHITLLLDSLVKYPLRLLGLLKISEITNVVIPIMNEFREPLEVVTMSTLSGIPVTTEYLELQLSSADVDIDYVVVTVMPTLTGVTWYMYHYPYISCIAGVLFGISIQFGFVSLLLIMRYASIALVDEDEEGEGGEDNDHQGVERNEGGTIRTETGSGSGLERQRERQGSAAALVTTPTRSERGSLFFPGTWMGVRSLIGAESNDSNERSRVHHRGGGRERSSDISDRGTETSRGEAMTSILRHQNRDGGGDGGGETGSGRVERINVSRSVIVEGVNGRGRERRRSGEKGDSRKGSDSDAVGVASMTFFNAARDEELKERRGELRRRIRMPVRSPPSTVI